jgi:hypothetical protein
VFVVYDPSVAAGSAAEAAQEALVSVPHPERVSEAPTGHVS